MGLLFAVFGCALESSMLAYSCSDLGVILSGTSTAYVLLFRLLSKGQHLRLLPIAFFSLHLPSSPFQEIINPQLNHATHYHPTHKLPRQTTSPASIWPHTLSTSFPHPFFSPRLHPALNSHSQFPTHNHKPQPPTLKPPTPLRHHLPSFSVPTFSLFLRLQPAFILSS